MQIRPMSEGDITFICEIERLSFATPWPETAFHRELRENPYAHYFVVDIEGDIRGYLGVWLVMDEGHITNIAVHPDHRGKGYAKALVSHVIDFTMGREIGKLTLEVRPSNLSAIALYESFGFESVGRRKGYYTDTNEDALIMWRFDNGREKL